MTAGLRDPCRWCGAIHGPLCPHVRAIEYDAQGFVRRVEFHAPQANFRIAADGRLMPVEDTLEKKHGC